MRPGDGEAISAPTPLHLHCDRVGRFTRRSLTLDDRLDGEGEGVTDVVGHMTVPLGSCEPILLRLTVVDYHQIFHVAVLFYVCINLKICASIKMIYSNSILFVRKIPLECSSIKVHRVFYTNLHVKQRHLNINKREIRNEELDSNATHTRYPNTLVRHVH